MTFDKLPCGTLFEAAKSKGMKTGLVATSRITHATPASFPAHVVHRDMEDLFAEHQVTILLNEFFNLQMGSIQSEADELFESEWKYETSNNFYLTVEWFVSENFELRGEKISHWKNLKNQIR